MTPRSIVALLVTAAAAWASWLLWTAANSSVERTSEQPHAAVSPRSQVAEVSLQLPDTSLHAATKTDEAASIDQLNDALRLLERYSATDKEKALAYARETSTTFPETGLHAEARSAKEITLLVDLNRMPEARELVRAFIHAHPDSQYRPLVQGVTGIHPRPTGPRQP